MLTLLSFEKGKKAHLLNFNLRWKGEKRGGRINPGETDYRADFPRKGKGG